MAVVSTNIAPYQKIRKLRSGYFEILRKRASDLEFTGLEELRNLVNEVFE